MQTWQWRHNQKPEREALAVRGRRIPQRRPCSGYTRGPRPEGVYAWGGAPRGLSNDANPVHHRRRCRDVLRAAACATTRSRWSCWRAATTSRCLPLYTPTNPGERNVSRDRVLFGGISVYLQQHVALFRKDAAVPRSPVGFAGGDQGVREPLAVRRSEDARRHDRVDARRRARRDAQGVRQAARLARRRARHLTSSTCRTRC